MLSNPSERETVSGKKQHITTRTILGSKPYPKNKIIIGAIAIVGMVWVIIKIGYKACFIVLYLSIKMAVLNDKNILLIRPIIVSENVINECFNNVKNSFINEDITELGEGNMNLGIILNSDTINQIIKSKNKIINEGKNFFILLYII